MSYPIHVRLPNPFQGQFEPDAPNAAALLIMKRYLPLTALSMCLVLLAAWLVSFGLDQRRVYYGDFEYAEQDVKELSRLPQVLYGFGLKSWQELDANGAAELFRQAVARDPLFMDAWLKLAEAEIEVGNADIARKIATFCHTKISQVLRWKQTHTLLAHDLGMQDIFRHNLNYLVDRKKWLSDIFYLLDIRTKYETDRALVLLARGNRQAYLEWLMRWKRDEAAHTTWEAIEADSDVTDELLQDYVHFLVSQKDVAPAAILWRQHTGLDGIVNAGFEDQIMGRGFGWRMSNSRNKKTWQGRRVFGQSRKGTHALRISFLGKENLDWRHIYQIVPVTPEKSYQLTYWWKSKSITTDQGPFVEIYGYDVKGLYQKGPMAVGSRDWEPVDVAFTAPVDCHAVVMRLRRNASLRFDNKIQGVLWVDDFALAAVETNLGRAEVRKGRE
jgi:tetratricopeptide (TPR) repeat protein